MGRIGPRAGEAYASYSLQRHHNDTLILGGHAAPVPPVGCSIHRMAGANATDRSIFDDFSGYQTATDADYQNVLRHGIVTLDTNILLDLYRQHSFAVEQLFVAMECLGDRLWFSHQVLTEFHRNREGAAQSPGDEAEKAIDGLNDLQQKTLALFRTWARRMGLDSMRERTWQRKLDDGFEALREGIDSVLDDHDADAASDTSTDPVLLRLDPIVTGRRGAAMDAEAYATAVAEGKRRVAEKIPPGYRDAGKDKRADAEGAAGDYLVWEQFLSEAAVRGLDGLFVTRDVKDDWFRSRGGEVRGPRNELAEEYLKRTGKRLFMLRAASWIFHMGPLLENAPDSSSSADIASTVEALSRSEILADEGEEPGWTPENASHLMRSLLDHYPAQHRAIVVAHAHGGWITREEVYQQAGYGPERSLRGFTRPVERLTRLLMDRGFLPYYAEPALVPRYNFAETGHNRAVGFRLSDGFISAYRGHADVSRDATPAASEQRNESNHAWGEDE